MQVVLIVNLALGMTVGKVAAQCSHATLGLYKQMASSHSPQWQAWLQAWEVCCASQSSWLAALCLRLSGPDLQDEGEKTVVLGAAKAGQLEELQAQAVSLSLPCFLVRMC